MEGAMPRRRRCTPENPVLSQADAEFLQRRRGRLETAGRIRDMKRQRAADIAASAHEVPGAQRRRSNSYRRMSADERMAGMVNVSGIPAPVGGSNAK